MSSEFTHVVMSGLTDDYAGLFSRYLLANGIENQISPMFCGGGLLWILVKSPSDYQKAITL